VSQRQNILVFDSGLGGLTVFREIRKLRPDADYLYLGDDALFPYGALAPDALVARVETVIGEALAGFPADAIVIACNTASTLVLPPLRAQYAMPIIGTVPAIKPAAAATRSRMISVLATPGTVSRDYTAELIRDFAQGVAVTLVGSKSLAGLAESALRGEAVADEAIAAEIAPCFVEKGGQRTDVVVLACTHYPLLLDRLTTLAPWPVQWIDPAPAIARRVVQVLGETASDSPGSARMVMTAGGQWEALLHGP
jgi:glutamate racemase